MSILLTPPIAIILYAGIGALIFFIAGKMAPPEDTTDERKHEHYSSGEQEINNADTPGYKPFLLIACFFAILHLSILVIGMSNLSFSSLVFLVAIIAALIALMLG